LTVTNSDEKASLTPANLEEIVRQRCVALQGQLDQALKKAQSNEKRAAQGEIAASLLHNVGNVLSSAYTSVQIISECMGRIDISKIQQLTTLLQEHQDDLPRFFSENPKSASLLPFLEQLGELWSKEHEQAGQELGRLLPKMEHMTEIVRTQKHAMSVTGHTQGVFLEELVELSLEMCNLHGKDHGIQLVRNFRFVPRVYVETHQVVQILVNLITNAMQALRANKPNDRKLLLSIERFEEEVVFIVTDNGDGIAEEDLDKVFSFGFSTREKGQGIGLHASARAAQVMGGTLTCHSQGQGQGASFRLGFPLTLLAPAKPDAIDSAGKIHGNES
jgi:signal transduction histidine kinase